MIVPPPRLKKVMPGWPVPWLRPHTGALVAEEQPFTLKLPNLWHLATDVEGTLTDGSSALDLVQALHPTAAVAGTPTDVAIELIRDIEPFDRGLYAAPIGYFDARGEGEFFVGLRSALLEPSRATLFAGAGIVGDSDPEAERLETFAKRAPMMRFLAALEGARS